MRSYKELLPYVAALPSFLWQCYFLCVPLVFIFFYSITTAEGGWTLTSIHYRALLATTYATIIWNSFLLASLTGALTLLIAYPVAYYIAVYAGKHKNLFLLLLILPSWTSFIVQVYSWFFVLQREGVLSRILVQFGITAEPWNFLNNYGATIFGMTYCFLPFMLFPLYSVLERMDKRLLEASADLGANRWQTFCRIVLPLSLPGIKVGLFLVMVPAFGEFAIPDLMGGFRDMYLGRVVMEKFILYRDWYSGAATVMLSILFPLGLIGLVYGASAVRRYVDSQRLARERGDF